MMAKNVKRMVAASLGLMMVPLGSVAAPASVSTPAPKAHSGAVVQELTALEQQGALLQQQLKNAQLEQEIANAQKTSAAKARPEPVLGSTSVRGPSVLLLTGTGHHYTATIQLPNGQILPAMVGALLPGGYRITKISSDGVWAERDGRIEALPFAVANPPDTDSGANPLGGGDSYAALPPSAGPLPPSAGPLPESGFSPSGVGATGVGVPSVGAPGYPANPINVPTVGQP